MHHIARHSTRPPHTHTRKHAHTRAYAHTHVRTHGWLHTHSAEARLVATLHHPNVIRFYGATYAPGPPGRPELGRGVIVTEFAEGGGLAHHIHRDTREVGRDRFYPICLGIASGIRYRMR